MQEASREHDQSPALLARPHGLSRIAVKYLDGGRLARFGGTQCGGERESAGARRRRVGVDPWGMAYWLRAERPDRGIRRITVYSMGPNRRRDGRPGETAGDDIAAVGVLHIPE